MTKSIASVQLEVQRVDNHVKTVNCFVTPYDGLSDVAMCEYDNIIAMRAHSC